MTPRQKRLTWILLGVGLVTAAVGLVLFALKNNVSLYFTPTQVYHNEAPQGRNFRIGGLVEEGSVKREQDGLTVRFNITDTAQTMPVIYRGILPDLFKEGKGVVAQGKLEADNVFRAEEVLAKHDENYMPPEATDAINKAEAAKSTPGTAPSAAYPAAN
ncbi:MAG: cytochrome c maturation protein CcmE [Sideroxyarcus sp.]|nr:cytochrome c maturation protein CcmE [Sideroxyarcus sp.]